MSIATENFIKAVYQSTVMPGENCRPTNIAKKLGISSAAATDMAKNLAKDNLVKYEKYQEFQLTEKGDTVALNVIRKHRLWETFLYNVLDLDMHEIHREAEGLEHLTSDFLADKIDEFLDCPQYDPHGDPIPSATGVFPKQRPSVTMNKAKEGKRYTLVRTVINDEDFFNFCQQNGIIKGAKVLIQKQYASDITEVKINKKLLLLPNHISKYLYLTKIKK